MNRKVLFFGKILLAQFIALGISIWLTQNIFVSASVPEVKARVKILARNIPENSINFIRHSPENIKNSLENRNNESNTIDDIPNPDDDKVVSPPTGEIVPTTIPIENAPTNPVSGNQILNFISSIARNIQKIVLQPVGSSDQDPQSHFGPQLPPPYEFEVITSTPAPETTPTNAPQETSTPVPTQTEGVPTTQPTQPILPTAIQPPTSTPKPTAVLSPEQSTSPSSLESGIVVEVNKRRKAAGIGELKMNNTLTLAARGHSVYMSQGSGLQRCNHQGAGGTWPPDRTSKVGYRGVFMGETVVCLTKTPEESVSAWWTSPRHKAILTDPKATEIGVGWNDSYWTAITGIARK